MKATELISELQKQIDLHGDADVLCTVQRFEPKSVFWYDVGIVDGPYIVISGVTAADWIDAGKK